MAIYVLGRFPPPIDGQTIATERLAALLENDDLVIRASTEPGPAYEGGGILRTASRGMRFLSMRATLRDALGRHPRAPVLWPSISPDPLGHFRDLAVALPAVRRDQRLIAVVHRGNFRNLFESPLTKVTARRVARRVAVFVFLTHDLARQCDPWLSTDRHVVIPNTISAEMIFSDAEIEKKLAHRTSRDRLQLLFIGHMMPSKGYLDALAAAEILTSRGTSVKISFIGRWIADRDRREFDEHVRMNGLQDVVTHYGQVSERGLIRSALREADVLLLPTYYRNEAQPMVILEAFNAATPVVSTYHGGIPELVTDGEEGLLVPPRDASSLAQAISRFAEASFWRARATEARKTFLVRYSPDAVRDLWLDLLRDGESPVRT